MIKKDELRLTSKKKTFKTARRKSRKIIKKIETLECNEKMETKKSKNYD